MYRAKDTFWAPDNRRIVKGDLVAPHDPVLVDREELFEEVVIPQAVTPPPRPAAKKTAAKKPATPPTDPDGDNPAADTKDGGEAK